MKKLKGIILAVIISLASIMMPFSVYADTISNSNVNINYYLDSVTEVSSGSYLQTYKVDFIFDQSYLGWISTKLVGTYVNNNTLPTTTSQFTFTKAIYVNGSIASTTVSFTTPNTISNGALQSLSQSIQNSNVTPLADLSTLDDILNVLSDIQNTLNIDVMDDLDQILIDVGLASDYLEILSKLREYSVPIESLAFTASVLKFNNNLIENSNYTYSIYPIIAVKTRNYLYAVWSQQTTGEYYLIIGTDSIINTIARFNQYFEITNSSIISINPVYSSYYSYDFYIIKFSRTNNGYCYFRNIADVNLIPIYMGSVNNKNLSTEFALQWGLSNQLLDDLHIIANGTNQSSSAASDLESGNDQMADDMDDLATIESGYNQQFNNQLQQIDFSSPLQNNAGILPAANFVITIFNGLINNNPFSVLIIIVCILLIGKKVIGK